jgi:hypothetical protein
VKQPTLSEELLVAETRRNEAETRYLQELDRVCALSSPRIAFERRLDYLSGIRTWNISCGMIIDDEGDDDDDDIGPYPYTVSGTFGFDLDWEDGTRRFLSKDHGNVVEFSNHDYFDLYRCSQKIILYPGYKDEDDDDGNKETGGAST